MANTFYHGDCLFVLTHDVSHESVDLIYLDPPFFTGKIQTGKWKGEWHPEAMEVSFEDSKRFWAEKAMAMRQKAPEWLKHVALRRPDFASYLYYMMERLQACYNVLSKNGSIYLHCDYRASHYLKMIMDEIFGSDKLRSEIVWCYYGASTSKGKKFPRKHDTIFWYSKSNQWVFNTDDIRIPYKEKTKDNYKVGLKGSGTFYDGKIKHASGILNDMGKIPPDWWEIAPAFRSTKENVGYPTQKPEALLTRIIKASSKERDLILDPFCGCGTAMIVASKLNRQFIGIDIDTSERKKGELPTAFSVIKNRSHELFEQSKYVTRDISEVSEMDGRAFELWVNEFYKATKPSPDRGVDGVTQEGIPIQSKVYEIKYDKLSQFINDAKYHPKVPKPIKKILAVSQSGFDDSARKLKFEIETAEKIEVCLTTPEEMLKLDTQ